MRHKGSISEDAIAMREDFYNSYKKVLASSSYIKLRDIVRKAINSPAPRFYVSPERALAVIQKIKKGESIAYMSESRKDMYSEIFNRVHSYLEANPYLSIREAIRKVINSPAPKFYINEGTAIVTLHYIKKQCTERLRQRFRVS